MILNEIEIKYEDYAKAALHILNQCKVLNIPLNGVVQEHTVEIAEIVLQSTIDYNFADETDVEVIKVKRECVDFLSRIGDVIARLPK